MELYKGRIIDNVSHGRIGEGLDLLGSQQGRSQTVPEYSLQWPQRPPRGASTLECTIITETYKYSQVYHTHDFNVPQYLNSIPNIQLTWKLAFL